MKFKLKLNTRSIKDKSGYTFIEMLLVMIIIGLLMIILTPMWNQQITHSLGNRMCLDQLMAEINLAKDIAMTENHKLCLNFDADSQCIYYKNNSLMNTYSVQYLPADLVLLTDFQFCYLADGNVNGFRTVKFLEQSTQNTYELVFQMASGKFYIRGNE